MATATTASEIATASGKNLCVKLNYSSIPAPNCARETIAVNHDHSSLPHRPQLGSLKQQLGTEVVCNSNKMTPGIPNKKHVPQKIDSYSPPAQKQSNQDLPPLKKSSKPSKAQTVTTSASNLAKRGNVSSQMHALTEDADELPQTCIKHPIVLNESCNSNRPMKLPDYVLEDVAPSGHGKEGLGQGGDRLTSQSSVSHYQSLGSKFGNQCSDAKDSFVTAKVSDDNSSMGMSSGSIKASDVHVDSVESRKSSICRGSTSSDVSDESSSSSFSSSINRPHRANDSRWEAIQAIRLRDGVLGLNHFRLVKRLGCGDIGNVYLSELGGTRNLFAMKVMDKVALANRKKLLRAQTEREILQSLDHPFLPTLYTHFETDKFSCLVMEFCPGGDLHALRQRQPGKYFPEHAARFYVAEVLLSLEYLHMLGIIYRDLKPENVLVRDDGHIMLSDFDLSLRCAVCPTLVKSSNADVDSSKNSAYCAQPACIEPTCIQPSCIQPTCFAPRFLTSRSKKEKKVKQKTDIFNQVSPLPELIAEPTSARSMSFVGTHEYLAPEIIKGEGHGSAVDWWTFGIFLYELLFGKTPFKGSGNRATLFNVVGQPLRFPETPIVSFAARDLIKGLLVKEPQNRLAHRRGATELKQHPFFQSVNWALIRCASPPDVPKPVEVDFPPKKVQAASTSEKAPAVDVKPSDKYLEIDFF